MHLRFLIPILALTIVQANAGQAQTDTMFTYQGELKQSGQPANGNYDLTFSLWTASASGSQIGGDLTINNVSVSDGNFAVGLDFGAAAFDNTNRWLEIEVNGQILAPRQLISRSPYSIQTRGIFVDAAGRVGIGTTNPTAELYVDGSASTTATSVVVHHPGGATGDLAISSPGGSVGFIVNANGGNRRDIRFTDQGISLLTNNGPTIPGSANGLTITENGHAAVGTTSPPTSSAFYASSAGSLATVVHGHYTHPTGTGAAIGGQSDSDSGFAGLFLGGRNYFQGNVGIGAFPPQYKLDVDGEVRLAGLPVGFATDLHINSDNRIFRVSSSRRYKENIKPLDLDEASEAFLQLKPVSYNYIGSSEPDIGLIAEEVAEVVPEMVVFDPEGRPDSVKYDKGVLYLLDLARSQRDQIDLLNQRIDNLEQSLAELQKGL